MYKTFMEEYLTEATQEMYKATKSSMYMLYKKNYAQALAANQNDSEDTSYKNKINDKLIFEDNNDISLELVGRSLLSKIITNVLNTTENIRGWRDYKIICNNEKVGDLTINIISSETVNIVWINIYDKYQGNKYGQRTLDMIIRTIMDNGFRYVTLEVPETSSDARHIYEKFGFKVTGSSDDENNDDIWGGLTYMQLDTNDYIPLDVTNINESYMESVNEKEGVYKVNYYLRDNLQIPYIEKTLAKPRVQDQLIEFVAKFLDDHSKELSTSGPVHIIVFGDKETTFLYEMFGVTKEMILEMYDKMIEETFYGKISKFITGWVKNAPHKILLTAMLIESIQKEYNDIIECCEYLWAFSEYPILYRDYWKTGVKEDVMDYTIEHLGTKFTVKKVSNLQALLKYDAHVSVTNKYELLKSGADHAYTDFMYRFRNQFNNRYKNIALAYYANNEENASQHVKDSQFDDGKLVDQDGHTTNIAQIVDKSISSFITGEVNNAYAKICADGSSVDKDNLIGYLNLIFKTKDNKLNKIVENIITAFFLKNPSETTVGTITFMNFGLALYRSIGTSKDPLYQEIKTILNYWIYDLINIKQFYSREGTWIAYTRAIFNYLIFMIHEYN